jgi:hypothetical protein
MGVKRQGSSAIRGREREILEATNSECIRFGEQIMSRRVKQIIPYLDLLGKLQFLLSCYPDECRNIHIDGVEVYRGQVDDANWRVATYRRSGDDNDLAACRERIAQEIRVLRESYDADENSPRK